MSVSRHDIALTGCSPEPLMAYLKALGVLRLISEQADPEVRGWWKNENFYLRTILNSDALANFFIEEYCPTPILVPWSGADFFGVNWSPKQVHYKSTPTSSKVIEAFLAVSGSNRLKKFRNALIACKSAMEMCGIDNKNKMESLKWEFIQTLRSVSEEIVDWIDAAAVPRVEKFAALLRSGGGSDGNTHFSDNFMQNLWDTLPDFDGQRIGKAPSLVAKASRSLLNEALLGVPCNDLIGSRTSSLYDSGALGGPNATQGMKRGSISKPWNVILALEGTVCFAGAVAKRFSGDTGAAFPFQVLPSITSQDRLVNKEQAGSELWLPLWERPASCSDVLHLLREGRAQNGQKIAWTGIDVARALSSLGVDRGIKAFRRYMIVKGRVGGDNYNTAVPLGNFDVTERPGIDLLRQLDSWLDKFRPICARGRDKHEAPERIVETLNMIETSILEFCRYGGPFHFQKIVIALGRAERELARTSGKIGKNVVPPIPLLSSEWLEAADDGTDEFVLARALVSLHDGEDKIGPFRSNLEPVDWKAGCKRWAEKDRSVVWNTSSLADNFVAVLQRRLLDAARAGCSQLPLASCATVPIKVIAAYLDGKLVDERIEELLWGLMLIGPIPAGSHASRDTLEKTVSLPRCYALLKLLFLAEPLYDATIVRPEASISYLLQAGYSPSAQSRRELVAEASISYLLQAGRIGEACAIAMRRLRESGFPVMPGPLHGRGNRDDEWRELDASFGAPQAKRLASALLFPVSERSARKLAEMVTRDDKIQSEDRSNNIEEAVMTNL